MTEINFPFRIDNRGRTARTDRPDHLHDLVEQVLFTKPGQRVNRPTFGCGLQQLLFEPTSGPLALTAHATVQAALNYWLGELIAVDKVAVQVDDSVLRVSVSYTVRATDDRQVSKFRRTL